jgi:transposase
MAKYKISLDEKQRHQLVEIISKGKPGVRVYKRAQILLLSEEEVENKEIAKRVGVGTATVERVRRKFVEQGLAVAISEKLRPGRQRKLDGKAEAFLVATACSDAPEGRSEWTMQLLAERLVELELVDSISDETVRRTLKKTNSSRG